MLKKIDKYNHDEQKKRLSQKTAVATGKEKRGAIHVVFIRFLDCFFMLPRDEEEK